jgi:hypothetical protein
MVRIAQTGTSGSPQRLGWWIDAIGRRWPSWLAIVLVTASLLGGEDSAPDTVHGFGEALLLPLGYLILAKLERRRATWLVVIIALGAMTVLRVLNLIPPSAVIVTVALLVLVWVRWASVRRTNACSRSRRWAWSGSGRWR